MSFTRKGLNLTYYQVGIHRMIKVELPDHVSDELKSENITVKQKAKMKAQLFRDAKISASNFNADKYKLLEHNCVTAVANILNTVDPCILGGKKKVVPLVLDGNIKQATLLEAMVDESLRGNTMDKDKSKDKDFIQSDSVAHQIWEEVMTPVSQIKQKDMKQQLQSMATVNDEAPEPPQTGHSV